MCFLPCRYLSAARTRGKWRSTANKLGFSLTDGVLSSDEEEDILAASFTSQRTVCSDAFDFLFDKNNLDPAKIMESGEIERYTEEKLAAEKEWEEEKKVEGEISTGVQQSACCVVS